MPAEDANLLHDAMSSESPSDDTARRILGAAVEQAEDFGFRRFTVEQVARRAGISRVTIYRYFPKKDQLVKAVFQRELRRFLTKLDKVISTQNDPEGKLTEGVLFCVDFLRGHRVLNRILRTEPELILPYLTTKAGPLVRSARKWLATHIRAEIESGHVRLPDQDADVLAELLVRMVISLVVTPDTLLPLDSPEDRKRLIQLYIRPLVEAYQAP